eukprot:1838811-Pyramimonas_sp.AAC.1
MAAAMTARTAAGPGLDSTSLLPGPTDVQGGVAFSRDRPGSAGGAHTPPFTRCPGKAGRRPRDSPSPAGRLGQDLRQGVIFLNF